MEIRLATIKDWNRIVGGASSATFFHTSDWYTICQQSSNFNIETLIFKSNEQEAILPLYSVRSGLLRRKVFISSPFGTYGGLVYNEHCKNGKEFIYFYQETKRIYIQSNPYGRHRSIPFMNSFDYFTQVIYLYKIKQSFYENWSSKHLASLKKSKEIETSISETEDKKDWQQYYNLYKQVTVERGSNSTNSYHQSLFDEIYNLNSNLRKLILLKQDNEILSGGIFYIFNKRMFYWHGVSSKKGKDYASSFSLIDFAIQYAIRLNLDVFDFLPSGGHKGVVHFKKGFGSEVLICNKYNYDYVK